MKPAFVLIIFAFSLPAHITFSQTRKKTFNTTVYRMSDKKMKGQLLSVNESTIEIKTRTGNEVLPVQNIRTIDIRRKGAPAKGMIIGGVLGVAAGGIIARASYKDEPGVYDSSDLDVTVGMVLFGPLGVLAGGLIGSHNKEHLKINGDPQKFQSHIQTLQQYQVN